jgi:hypothetical protein
VQFDRAAEKAIADGREHDAILFRYAAALTSQEPAPMQWVNGLHRPLIALRWGIGVHCIAGRKRQKDPKPIGGAPDSPAFRAGDRPRRELLTYTGELGERLLEELTARSEDGRWCRLLRTPAASEGLPQAAPERRPTDDEPAQPTLLSPGITYLGKWEASTLTRLSQKQGLHVAAIFEVQIRDTRKGATHNSTALRLVDVESRKKLYTTTTLNNIQVSRARRDPLAEDPVDAAMRRLFAFVDENLTMGDPPADLNASHARRRAASLAAYDRPNPLQGLTELRWYRDLGLLRPDELAQAYQDILGEEGGRKLASGAPRQKVQMLAKMIHSAALTPTGSSGY